MLDRFYAKAAKVQINLRPQLDFILKISDDMDEIQFRTKLDVLFKEFMNASRTKQVLEKVPVSMQAMGRNARGFLATRINAINKRSEIEYTSTIKYDNGFYKSFKNWDHNPVDQAHVQQVVNDIGIMRSKYDELHGPFIVEMNAIYGVDVNFASDIDLANSLFDRLLASTNALEIRKLVEDSLQVTIRMADRRKTRMTTLEHVRNILKDYNQWRIIWAEFIIGMRQTLSSERHLVQLNKFAYVKNRVKHVAMNLVKKFKFW